MIKALAFFGAFNPPTKAHIMLADFVRRSLGFDYVVFVPSKEYYIENTQQKNFAFTDQERFEMLTKIAEQNKWMKVSDYELKLEEQPRSYHTMKALKEIYGYSFRFLMGSDKLPELEKGWKFIDEICREFGFVCMTRTGNDAAELIRNDRYLSSIAEYITLIETPEEFRGISSTEIRCKFVEMQNILRQLDEVLPEELNGLLGYIRHKE